MMALQKSLLEQSDIVPVLKGMDFVPTGRSQDTLTILNPPVVQVGRELLEEYAGTEPAEEE
jgi:hypothetical protein